MIKTDIPIILASASPRRSKLLKQMNLEFNVLRVEVDERFKKEKNPYT